MRVGISGTHGTGKTTLAGALCAHLPGHVTADEPYYLLEEEGHEFGFPPSLEDYRALSSADARCSSARNRRYSYMGSTTAISPSRRITSCWSWSETGSELTDPIVRRTAASGMDIKLASSATGTAAGYDRPRRRHPRRSTGRERRRTGPCDRAPAHASDTVRWMLRLALDIMPQAGQHGSTCLRRDRYWVISTACPGGSPMSPGTPRVPGRPRASRVRKRSGLRAILRSPAGRITNQTLLVALVLVCSGPGWRRSRSGQPAGGGRPSLMASPGW